MGQEGGSGLPEHIWRALDRLCGSSKSVELILVLVVFKLDEVVAIVALFAAHVFFVKVVSRAFVALVALDAFFAKADAVFVALRVEGAIW